MDTPEAKIEVLRVYLESELKCLESTLAGLELLVENQKLQVAQKKESLANLELVAKELESIQADSVDSEETNKPESQKPALPVFLVLENSVSEWIQSD